MRNRQFHIAQSERRLAETAPDIALRILGAVLGGNARGVATFRRELGDAQVVLHNRGQNWEVLREGRREAGQSPIGLLSCVLGISPGHAARMILETASATRFEPEIAHAIQVAVDAGGCAPGGKVNRAVPPGLANRAVLGGIVTR